MSPTKIAQPAVAGVTAEDMWTATVRALAEVRVIDEAELLAEANALGDMVIKSKDAEVVVSTVEVELLGDIELVDQSHLGRRELTSLRTLADLLWRRWVEAQEVGTS